MGLTWGNEGAHEHGTGLAFELYVDRRDILIRSENEVDLAGYEVEVCVESRGIVELDSNRHDCGIVGGYQSGDFE